MQILKTKQNNIKYCKGLAFANKGFTLIELLIVVAIIAILASVIFVALNPLQRFQDTRDADRIRDVTTILEAVKIDQIDNGGSYQTTISSLSAGSVYLIVDGSSMVASCDDNNTYCDTNISSDSSCVNLSFLKTEGYLGEIPISPAGEVVWDDGDTSGEKGTGYTLSRSTDNVITVRACESENTTEISTSG
jgi:prepilin-type N-terminal cleavage/methylation domain-containing protein